MVRHSDCAIPVSLAFIRYALLFLGFMRRPEATELTIPLVVIIQTRYSLTGVPANAHTIFK